MAPTYRERLRAEGAMLAAAGVAGSVVLLATQEQAKRRPESTVIQLAILAVGLAVLGRLVTAKALGRAGPVEPGEVGSGEPTPLWHVPVPVIALALLFGLPWGWDAALRVTVGSALVGLYQAVVIERQVALDEAETRRRYYRMPGSRVGKGTVLGWTRG